MKACWVCCDAIRVDKMCDWSRLQGLDRRRPRQLHTSSLMRLSIRQFPRLAEKCARADETCSVWFKTRVLARCYQCLTGVTSIYNDDLLVAVMKLMEV